MIAIILTIIAVIYYICGIAAITIYGTEAVSMDEVKYAYRDFEPFMKMVIAWPYYLPKWMKIRKDNKD